MGAPIRKYDLTGAKIQGYLAPNIMKAKQKPLQIIDLPSLDLDLRERTKVLQIKNPPRRPSGVMLTSITELLDKLQHEEKVLP